MVGAGSGSAFPPGFEAGPRIRSSIKCGLIAGHYCGRPAVAKVLEHPDPVWRWYFERERAIYQLFEREPPPVRSAKLLAHSEDALILEPMGEPMGTGRILRRAVDPAPLLDILRRLSRWNPQLPADPPPQAVLRTMQDRLLEDPTSPWVLHGIERCVDLGIFSRCDADSMIDTLSAHPSSTGHGDLLPRNVVGDPPALVDWECAGPHPDGWDRALLWVNLPEARAALEDVDRPSDRGMRRPLRPAFRALAAFAVAREIKFARRSSAKRRGELQALLESVLER